MRFVGEAKMKPVRGGRGGPRGCGADALHFPCDLAASSACLYIQSQIVEKTTI